MLDSLGQAIVEILLEVLFWLVLWPVVLIISTPFVLLYAAVLALRRKQRFSYAVADGYSAVSDFLMKMF